MIYFDKHKVKSKTVYKITHVNGDDILITNFCDGQKVAGQLAKIYANKRGWEMHKSFKI